MTSSNQVISINNDKYLIRKTPTKLVLHHLPSLDILHKYYSEVGFFAVNQLQIMLLYKNTLTFLKPKCPPLRLIEYQQQYLDWQPIGGLAMANMLILYDKATIAFYYRSPKLQKSWSIEVVQAIEEVRHSQDQKFIALKVKQPHNTIFVWDMNNMSKKPNQQILLNQDIVKWDFYGDNLLLVMTQTEFKVYFPHQKTNQHFLQYYLTLPKRYVSFLALNQFSGTEVGSGRKSVNNFAFMLANSCNFDIVQLYDVEKRQARFKHSDYRQLRFNKLDKLAFSSLIAGYEYEERIHMLGQIATEMQRCEPRCLVLDGNFELERVTEYKQHQGVGLEEIQHQNTYVLYKEKDLYRLGRFTNADGTHKIKGSSEHIKLIREYNCEGIEAVFLTKQSVVLVNSDKKVAVNNLNEIQKHIQQQEPLPQVSFSIEFAKFPAKQSHYIYQTSNSIFFICGIRYFKYDLTKKQFINIGFVLKNQRAKLHQLRTSTSSLVYKINQQYVLIEYSILGQGAEKMTFRTVKSSETDQIISLRKDKWLKVNLKQIVLGEGDTQLTTFNLQKMFKSLLQENTYFDYDLYWTTHAGIILAVKNYLFFLQITSGQNGSQIHLIKKGHSYLYRRFSSSIKSQERITVVDPRNLVIYTGSRILKLGTSVQSYITQNPYEIPDTLLHRQLRMRQYFCPHHPSVINAMLQNGWFLQIVKFMEKISKWVEQHQHSIRTLYQAIQIEDYYEREAEENGSDERDEYGDPIVKKPEIRNEANDIGLLNKVCQNILSDPQNFHLSQSNPLLLQNILKAVAFQLQNTRSFDYFSRTVITKTRLQQNKSKPFTTMDVAFLLHSINKDEAIQFLKGPDHKMDWNWVQRYSIVLWYEENVQKWKKWIEEIAMTQFRVHKDPFDCLFWYVLAGKKNLLVTLFKAQKFSSKEHEAMHTFLQRDFEDAKHKTAAVKNAYALIDKKRYMHAMAFLLLADKKEECVRFAIDRLNDLNLGYLIHLVSYTSSKSLPNQINQVSKTLIEKGDVWSRHIGWVMEKRHVASYNVLLKEGSEGEWEYGPGLKRFHPAVVEFAKKIKEGIPYKREVEMKNASVQETSPSMNFDHLKFDMDSFDMSNERESQQVTNVETTSSNKQPQFYTNFSDILQELPEQQENGFKRALNEQSIKHYMRYHFPCLALTLVSQEQSALYGQVKRAYELEKYMLTGELSELVKEVAEELDDVMGLLRSELRLGRDEIFLDKLADFTSKFESVIRKIKINELNPPQKHQIGQLLHYSFFSEQIFIELEPLIKSNHQIKSELHKLSKANSLGKIISGICLKVYSQMGKSLEAFRQNIFIQSNQQFWTLCRQKYDKIVSKKKEKHQKLMDVFELSLNKHIKKVKDEDHADFNIKMPKPSTMSLLLWRKIMQFLSRCDSTLKDKILQLKLRLDKIVTYWLQKEYIDQIQGQINILMSEGVQYRLKLNILSEQFPDRQLDTFEELLKLIYSTKELREIQGKKNSQQINVKPQNYYKKDKESLINKQQIITDEKPAVEIFKNKSDFIKNFTLNTNDGKGLEVLVLFKKTMRKFEVTDNLANRDRSKDGDSLIHEDSACMTDPIELPSEQQILAKSYPSLISDTLKKLFISRKLYDGQELIKRSERYIQHIDEYLRQCEPLPQIDFSQVYSIQSHYALPIYLLGGKGVIEVCRFDTVKCYNRIICPGMAQIVKLQSIGQRLYLLDKEGSFACFLFDYTFAYKPVFELRKMGVVDFACSSPSQFGCITSNSFQFYDTLLHPKRQCVFKVQMSTPPVGVACLSSTQFVILRKQQVQIYDISKGQMMESYNIQGRGRSLFVDRARGQNYSGKILVGRGDCRVKIIDLEKRAQSTVRAGHIQQQKQKVYIETIKKFGELYVCFRNDGSLYCFSE